MTSGTWRLPPYVIDGELTIYFESEISKREYLAIDVEHPGTDFETNLDNPVAMGPGDVASQGNPR